MPGPARERELNDRLRERVKPLLLPVPPQPKGGRPFADDRACFEGIVYLLRNGLRWRQLPVCYPSGVTGHGRGRGVGRRLEAGAGQAGYLRPAGGRRVSPRRHLLRGAKGAASGSARAGSARARPSTSSCSRYPARRQKSSAKRLSAAYRSSAAGAWRRGISRSRMASYLATPSASSPAHAV